VALAGAESNWYRRKKVASPLVTLSMERPTIPGRRCFIKQCSLHKWQTKALSDTFGAEMNETGRLPGMRGPVLSRTASLLGPH
jgi:hypothetical protein